MKAPALVVGRLALAACALDLAITPPASADWTIGLFTGGCRTQETSLALVQPADETSVTLSPIHYNSASFEAPIYYGYRVGVFPAARWFGIEGEFIHVKVIADTARTTNVDGMVRGRMVTGRQRVASVIERFSITHGVNLLLINALVRREQSVAQGRPRWILVGRFGAGGSIPHPESTAHGVTFERYEWGAFSAQAAAAAEVRLGGAIYLSGEYKLTRTVQDVAIARGSARTPLVTHHLVVGLGARLLAGRG